MREGNRSSGPGQAPAEPVRDRKATEFRAAKRVAHLEKHPQDTEPREKLAVLYADHYHRAGLATDQLEQRVSEPNRPQRLAVY